MKLNEARSPVPLVVLICEKGLVHETGTLLPATWIVGWPGSLLHSRTPPVELAVKPDPETVTLWPLVSPVDGETESVPVAPASAASATPPDAAASMNSATAVDALWRRLVSRIACVPQGALAPSQSPQTGFCNGWRSFP